MALAASVGLGEMTIWRKETVAGRVPRLAFCSSKYCRISFSVGETLFFLRKSKEALENLDKAIALDPEGPAGEFAKALKEAHGLGVFG